MNGRKIIITKRFCNNTLRIYQCPLKEFSSKTAYKFLDRLEKRIDFIAKNPTAGKLSAKRKNAGTLHTVGTKKEKTYFLNLNFGFLLV